MKTSISRFLLPALVFALIAGVSACKESTDAVIRVTVVQNVIDQISQDTVVEPVAQALVRFYQDEKVGTLWLEEIVTTGSTGVAEYVFANPAILKYDITHAGRSSLENFVILEQGETVEVTVNLDEL
jgi:ABC-type amino acid transport substrate-binding protein